MNILENVSLAIAIIAALVVIWGVILGLVGIVRNEIQKVRPRAAEISVHAVRHTVGSYLLLGLEFLIAADVVKTIVEPTLQELAILGGTVAIRTVISYFLGKEIGEG